MKSALIALAVSASQQSQDSEPTERAGLLATGSLIGSDADPRNLPVGENDSAGRQLLQLISSSRGGWPGNVAGARWMQGGTGLPG
jgi:hypothetical protein